MGDVFIAFSVPEGLPSSKKLAIHWIPRKSHDGKFYGS